ncbi:MAG: NAD-dependent epimerase/dehydratase family protein [Desulfobacterales bacterium]
MNSWPTYSHLYDLPCTGLRFLRCAVPETAGHGPFLFTKAILEDKPIQVFNHGKMLRDFTYIDDIVEGVVRVIDAVPTPNSEWSGHA